MKSISVRLRVYVDAELTLGPGRIELLERIEHSGSLAAAAREMGMSYRRAWLLMHSLNAGLRAPALVSVKGGRHGGGASVTATGRTLVKAYRQTEAECLRRIQGRFASFVRV
jgi:molybdate transport system regulatory protein